MNTIQKQTPVQKKKVIVTGAGAWGGWTAYRLQRAGHEVLLIDRYGPGNALSGSGGRTRIIRMAYGGDPLYTDLVERSFQLWRQYDEQWGESLYHETGALWMFHRTEPTYARLSIPAMKEKGYELRELDLAQAAVDYPQIRWEDIDAAFFEPRAGYLEAGRACRVVAGKFEEIGGKRLTDQVISIEGSPKVSAVHTERSGRLEADHFVFACGPWTSGLFPALKDFLYVSRQEVYYYQAPEDHRAGNLPLWLEFRPDNRMYYGIPGPSDQGFKLAYDEREWPLDPDKDDRKLTPEIFEKMSRIVAHRFPALKNAPLLNYHICVYENAWDGNFIIDRAPGLENALVLCGSSGHGFKMGPAIGEMVTRYLCEGQSFPRAFAVDRPRTAGPMKSQYEV